MKVSILHGIIASFTVVLIALFGGADLTERGFDLGMTIFASLFAGLVFPQIQKSLKELKMKISILLGVIVSALTFLVPWCWGADLSTRGEDLGLTVFLASVFGPLATFVVLSFFEERQND